VEKSDDAAGAEVLAVLEKRDPPKGADVVVSPPPNGGALPNKLEPPNLGGLFLVASNILPDEVVCGCEEPPRFPKGFFVSSALEIPRLPNILLV